MAKFTILRLTLKHRKNQQNILKYKNTVNMIFQHDGAALRGRFVFKFLALLTRVKFQVDWSKGA